MASHYREGESTAKCFTYLPPRRHPGLSDEMGFETKRPSFKQMPRQDRE